jgi:O-antigen/teichoic acid export membrane protein
VVRFGALARLGRNLIQNVAGQIGLMALGLIANALVYRRLGGDVLGLYYFSLAIAGVAGTFVDGGVAIFVVRETAARRESEPDYVIALHQTASLLSWGGALLAAVLIASAAPLIVGRWLIVQVLDSGTATAALALFVLAALLGVPRSLYSGLLRGLRHFRAANAVALGTSALQTGGALILLLAGARALAFAGWHAVASGLSVAIAAAIVAGAAGRASIRPRWSGPAFRRARSFLGWSVLIAAAAGILSYCDRLVLGAFLSAKQLAFYGTAASLTQKARQIITAIGQVGLPALSEAHGAGDEARVTVRYRLLDDLIAVGTLPLFAGVLFASPPVLAVVFDPATGADLIAPTTCLCFAAYVNGVLNTPYQLSLVYDQAKITARQNLLALVLVVPAAIFLTSRWGLVGAALSGVLYQVFAVATCIPRFARVLPIGGAAAWFARLGCILAAATLGYGLPLAILGRAGATHAIRAAVGWAGGSAIFGAVAWRFLLRPESRTEAARRLGALVSR